MFRENYRELSQSGTEAAGSTRPRGITRKAHPGKHASKQASRCAHLHPAAGTGHAPRPCKPHLSTCAWQDPSKDQLGTVRPGEQRRESAVSFTQVCTGPGDTQVGAGWSSRCGWPLAPSGGPGAGRVHCQRAEHDLGGGLPVASWPAAPTALL